MASKILDLVAHEAVLHLVDGETTIRGFLLDFYEDPSAVRMAKPKLQAPNPAGQIEEDDLGGEALVFESQIKFVQLLGG